VSLVALVIGLVAFVALLKVLRAAEVGGAAVREVRAAVATLSAATLSDAEKERAARRAAGTLFRSFLAIAGIGAVALAAPAAIVWAGSTAGLYTLDRVAEVALGWPFLLASSVGAVCLWIMMAERS
jgi:hypothetical protein